MRILFVSGVVAGGAPRSTLQLASLLAERGHSVQALLTDRPSGRSLYGILTRVHLKLERFPMLRRFTGRLMRSFGRSLTAVASDDASLQVFTGSVAENAYRSLVQNSSPDVVVVNSLPRIAFRIMSCDLEGKIPLVLYMREAHSITHLSISNLRPDGIVANSLEICQQVEALGLEVRFIPSIIDLDAATTDTSRQTVVMVNPIAENQPELLCTMARARPDVTFVLQESWPLEPRARASLQNDIGQLPNVEFRPRVDSPAAVYSDARVLVATYPTGRPRVVVEAQYNGIPVVALDQPALAEVTGPMDTLIAQDAPATVWLAAVERYLDDDGFYEEASESAWEWARRPAIAPERTAADFEEALAGLHIGGRDGS